MPGVGVLSNPARPRRLTRGPINAVIDLTVTPPSTSYNTYLQVGGVVQPGTIAPGELLYKTSGGKIASLATSGASNANAANCVGVSDSAYPYLYTQGVVGSSQPTGDPQIPMVQILEAGDFLFNTTSGDTYNAYDKVYLGADGRTIMKTATGTSVGYVSPDQRQTNQTGQGSPTFTPISGGSGVQVYIRVVPALAP
jgi:hypothetical protein